MSALGIIQTTLATGLLEAYRKDNDKGEEVFTLSPAGKEKIANGHVADWLRGVATTINDLRSATVRLGDDASWFVVLAFLRGGKYSHRIYDFEAGKTNDDIGHTVNNLPCIEFPDHPTDQTPSDQTPQYESRGGEVWERHADGRRELFADDVVKKLTDLERQLSESNLNLDEMRRLKLELAQIVNPEARPGWLPSMCDIVSYVRSDYQKFSEVREQQDKLVEALQSCVDAGGNFADLVSATNNARSVLSTIEHEKPPRFAVYPGNIRSQTDGAIHHIGFAQLCELYKVPQSWCVDMSKPNVHMGRDMSKLVALHPSRRGDYTLTEYERGLLDDG